MAIRDGGPIAFGSHEDPIEARHHGVCQLFVARRLRRLAERSRVVARRAEQGGQAAAAHGLVIIEIEGTRRSRYIGEVGLGEWCQVESKDLHALVRALMHQRSRPLY